MINKGQRLSKSSCELEDMSIPIDISDILNICQEYNSLGKSIQTQIQDIIEYGVEDSIKLGKVKKEYLYFIKNFLSKITKNAYFGDAVDQANECIFLIKEFDLKHRS